MCFAQIIKGFNATNLVTGEELKALLNKMVEQKKTIRVVPRSGVNLVLVNPDDLMPQAVRITGFSPVDKDAEFPVARLSFAMFGNYGFETSSNDPFEILKEVEAFKKTFECGREIQFSKGIEIKISKDLVKVIKNMFVKHEQKARVLMNKNEGEVLTKKVKQKLNILGQDESFYITTEGEEYYGITIDGSFCKAVVKASDEVADTVIDIAITLKTAVMAMVVTANKARDDIKRVINSIKK